MDRLHAMELFARVIETGSISAAARDLRLLQPAVSKGLAALEARLGVRLLVRTTRKLNPTDAGVALYERARRVLADADEAETAARGVAAGLDGRLRISAPVTFARMHLAPKLPAFLAAHPKLRLEVIMDDRDVDLLGENIDVALRVGTLPDSSVVARRIARCERCVVASPAYLAQAGTPHSPSDLLAHQAVIYVQGSGGDEWRFRRGTTELSVSVPSRLTFSAAEGVRGDGGMIVPARPQTRQGVLFCKKEPKNFCS